MASYPYPPPHSYSYSYSTTPPPQYPPPHLPLPASDPSGAYNHHLYDYGPSYSHHDHRPPHAAPLFFTREQQRIKTLFVSGLPDDVKAREIHNLFRRRPGFESCQLKYTGRGDQVVAFATFLDHRSAVLAISELNGEVFDPHTGAVLNIELARSNSRTKRARGGAAYTVIDKRIKASKDEHESSSEDGDGGSDEPLGTDTENSSNKDAIPATQRDEAYPNADNSQAVPNEKSLAGELPPCSTLFIASLGPNCTEEELKQVLSECSGFQSLKVRGRGGMPVAFADFKDVECSTNAMKSLQGKLLTSSDRGGMHIEFARSKMRRV